MDSMWIGYMDLSKIKVRGEESEACAERYRKGKIVHNIVQRTAINCDVELMKIYREIVWPLNKDCEREQYKAYDVFKASVQSPNPESFFKPPTLGEEVVKELVRQIAAKLSPHAIRIKADFEVTCFAFEGIDAIKEALQAGIQAGVEALAGEKPEEKANEADKLDLKACYIDFLLNCSCRFI